MSTSKIWWYAKGDKRCGPYTAAELKVLVADGQLAPNDMVWREGLANWLQVSSVLGLISSSASESALPPPLPNASTTSPPPLAPPEKQKMPIGAKVAFWVGGILLGLITLGVIGSQHAKGTSSMAQQASSEVPESPPTDIKVGDFFQTPTFRIQIQSAQTRSSVGNPPFDSQPAEGGTYIAIQWNYKNISQKPVNIFRRPRIYLKAPDRTKYNPDLGASSSYATEQDINTKVLSDLNPGIRVSDADVFEVSRQMFNPSTWKILVRDKDQNVEVGFVTATPAPSPTATTPASTSDIAIPTTNYITITPPKGS
jgi:hypothetical protein